MTVAQLAAANGLNPNGYLIAGTPLRRGGGGAAGPAAASVSQPVGAQAEGSAAGPPYTTPERVTAAQVGSIAAANGVPPWLAETIGWQESGFNNGVVSSADARGVMQILPGTWQWINSSLTRAPLSPKSATDNVRGGVLLLQSLLRATGGSPSLAAAGYYQGLPSVERHGLLPSTQRYVRDVMSLASSFGEG
jgi:soluble lytic murein transglycosylase-like protein